LCLVIPLVIAAFLIAIATGADEYGIIIWGVECLAALVAYIIAEMADRALDREKEIDREKRVDL
jgi:4-hydroxybenzoate polyprenyltransferase